MIHSDKQIKRIAHVKSHVDEGPSLNAVSNIVNNQGDPIACAMGLSSFAKGKAMLAWFESHDLNTMRQWWYVSAKLDQMWYQIQPDILNGGNKLLRLLAPLLSNNDALIDWFAHYDQTYDMKRVESHKTGDFWAYSGALALRGEWPRLIERCEKVINDPPKGAQQRRLLAHHFYLALAHGDTLKMEEILREMVTPKILRALYEENGGFTQDLISTSAVIYAKIAWRHGYEVKVDSPFIPQEWLQMEPLAQYDNYFSFLK